MGEDQEEKLDRKLEKRRCRRRHGGVLGRGDAGSAGGQRVNE